MGRLHRALGFLLLVGLLAGAGIGFVRTQILKARPSPISATDFRRARIFSPLAPAPRNAARFTITLRDPGRARVDVVDADGAVVRTLLPEAAVPAGRLKLVWDGADDAGTTTPDGVYRVRVRLPDQRRTITLPNRVELDATPPEVETDQPANAIVAPGLAGAAGELRFRVTASEPVRIGLVVARILPDRSSLVVYREVGMQLAERRTLVWHGDTGRHRAERIGPAAATGSYIVGWEAVDRAGNVVHVPEGELAPGNVAPATVARVAGVAIDPGSRRVDTPFPFAAADRYAPTATSLGPSLAHAEGPTTDVELPRAGRPGLFLLRAEASSRVGWAAEAVPGGARALVLVPTLSWQARNAFDGDGDGFPDLPPRPVGIDRPLGGIARRGVQTLAARTAALRGPLRDPGAITDVVVERAGVPRRARVVVLAGGEVWTPGLADALRAFLARGGTVLLLGDPPGTRGELAGDLLTVGPAAALVLEGPRVTRDVEVAAAAAEPPPRPRRRTAARSGA